MQYSGRTHALAATLRIPNVPSVISNVLLGVCLAAIHLQATPSPAVVGWVTASGCALYLAGNLLNDLADREWDARHRPERALPRRLFRPLHYAVLAIALTAIAWSCAVLASLPALGAALLITAAILVYTRIHKQTAWSVLPMALCRALLPVMGFVAVSGRWMLPGALLLASAALTN